ncbi:MAG: CdaR family protein [Nitrospirota bacterium]
MKNLIFHNFGLKIVAVLLAVVLWLFVTSRGQSEMFIEVPIEFTNIPPRLEMVKQSSKVVTLNIKGQERFIKTVKPSDVRVSIDLSKAKKGESMYYINKDDIIVPGAITVANMNPSSVRVSFEETMARIVRVVPVISGQPERGYSVKDISVQPQVVDIEGVRSEVARVNAVKTEPVDVTGLKETITQEAKLDLSGKKIRAMRDTVEVRIAIGPRGQ